MNILLTLLKKDFIDGFRNWEVILIVAIPIILSGIMGFALDISTDKLPNIALLTGDDPEKKVFPKQLFKEIVPVKNIEEGTNLLEKGTVHGVIIVPTQLDETVKAGKKPELRVILDDARGAKSAMIRGIVKKVLEHRYDVKLPLNLNFERFRGLSPKQRMLHMWILMGIFMIGLTILPMSVASEKEKKTLDALLTTPVTERLFLLSKLIWGALLMVINIVILLYFNEGMDGDWGGVILLLLASITAAVGIGLFIALICPTQSVTSMVSTFVLLTMIFSVSMGEISDSMRTVMSVFPGYHLAEGIQKTALFGKGIPFVWHHIVVMFGWGMLFFSGSWFLLKKRDGSL